MFLLKHELTRPSTAKTQQTHTRHNSMKHIYCHNSMIKQSPLLIPQWAHLQCESLQWTQAATEGANRDTWFMYV